MRRALRFYTEILLVAQAARAAGLSAAVGRGAAACRTWTMSEPGVD
ncbi:MAG: hypothetical protein HYR85_23140 [Planctomycetes bacterium]|nr:hypothetical protein [Planctomycetota bacterium]MBI3848422.1 hypothetical protein [Planctomycetota bacterium]